MAIYPQFRTIDDICRHHGQVNGDLDALVFHDSVTSHAQLDRYADKVAAGLAQDVERQQRVAVMAKNNDSFFELLMGASRGGFVLVGVNWRLAAQEVAYVLRDSQSRVLFIDDQFLPLLQQIRSDLPDLCRVVVFSATRQESDGDDAPDDYRLWRDTCEQVPFDSRATPDDVVLQLYTSGTTGRPKGVQLSHSALLSLREAEHRVGAWSQWDSTDVALVAMPLFHIGGAATGLIALYNGARAVILEEVDPARIIHLIEREKVTRTFLVPAAIKMVLEHPDCRPEAFNSLKIMLYGASPIPAALLQDALASMGCEFAQLYGMTETAGSMTVLQPDDHADPAAHKMLSCGRAYPGVEIAIADGDGNHLPVGSVGEIIIKGPSLMRGYWNLPDATREVLPGNGWLRSGDAGYLDEEGYLYIHDRVKDMIVSGGENIYPAEVESVLYGHPMVQDVAVIGVPSERWGEEVKAVVVLQPQAGTDGEQLIAYAREHIAGYKVPKSVDFVSELPRNASGKLLKKDIRAPYWQGRERQVN